MKSRQSEKISGKKSERPVSMATKNSTGNNIVPTGNDNEPANKKPSSLNEATSGFFHEGKIYHSYIGN